MFLSKLRTGRPAHAGPAITALALGGFGIGTGEFVPMGLLPEMADTLGVDVPSAGHIVSFYALGVVVGAPVLAVLGARLPRRSLLIGLMAAFAVGNVLSAAAPGYGSMNVARFVTGLPHGAYFGIAALVAADLAGPGRRARAIGQVMLGLSIANVAGVPAATWLGQAVGWRAAFVAVAVIGALTVLAIRAVVPATAGDAAASPRREFAGLANRHLWLTLLVGAIGGGALFSVYAYLAPTLTIRTGLSDSWVPVFLALWGVGMILGNLLGGWAADRRLVPTMFAGLAATTALLLAFTVTSTNGITAAITVPAIALSTMAVVPALQTRLMDIAGDAQTLGAAMNHAAFNVANALGPFLAGIALDAGLGWTAPSLVGAGLAVCGMLALAGALRHARRHPAAPSAPPPGLPAVSGRWNDTRVSAT